MADTSHKAVGSAERMVKSTTERVAEAAHQAIDRLSGMGGRTEDRLRETSRITAERGREYADQLGGYVSTRPLASIAIALGVGFLIGAIMRSGRN